MSVTSTETLKERIRGFYRTDLEDIDNAMRESVRAWKTMLLCRGYQSVRGKRGGVKFVWVGHVPEDSPLWKEVTK